MIVEEYGKTKKNHFSEARGQWMWSDPIRHTPPAEAMGFFNSEAFQDLRLVGKKLVSTCFNSFQSQFFSIFRVFPKMGDPQSSHVVTIGFKHGLLKGSFIVGWFGPPFRHHLTATQRAPWAPVEWSTCAALPPADPGMVTMIDTNDKLVGGFSPYPSEKYESAGMMTFPIYGKS